MIFALPARLLIRVDCKAVPQFQPHDKVTMAPGKLIVADISGLVWLVTCMKENVRVQMYNVLRKHMIMILFVKVMQNSVCYRKKKKSKFLMSSRELVL